MSPRIVTPPLFTDGDPYYPVPTKANQEVFQRYKELTAAEQGVFFVGRSANYKYYNMDAAILADKFVLN